MQPPTGRIVFERMGPQIRELFGLGFGAELFYSFVIIVCSLMIYFGTKELYELSSYKGIKYFRQTFLFFAIAYFFRNFIKFIVTYFGVKGIIDFSPATFGATGLLTQVIFMYFSSMSIFFLLYSVMWKKWDGSKIYIFHLLAIIIALISISSRSHVVYLYLNLFLLAVVVFTIYISSKHLKKKGFNFYLIYVLLSIFWILNIIDALIPKFFSGFQLFIYMASTGIFLFILYKVLKNTGA